MAVAPCVLPGFSPHLETVKDICFAGIYNHCKDFNDYFTIGGVRFLLRIVSKQILSDLP